jgi:hypothetical protein
MQGLIEWDSQGRSDKERNGTEYDRNWRDGMRCNYLLLLQDVEFARLLSEIKFL